MKHPPRRRSARWIAITAATVLLASVAAADWTTEKTKFEVAYATDAPEDRIAAVKAIVEFDHPEGMALLLDRYAGEKDFDVRKALADAMNSLTNVRARDVFRDTILKHPDADTRTRFCALFADGRMLDRFEMLRFLLRDPSEQVRARALRNLGPSDAALAGDASKLVDDAIPDVRMAACSALGIVKSDAGVPALLRIMETEKSAEIKWAAGDALGKISGQQFGEDLASWKAWWNEKCVAGMTPVEKALYKGGEYLKPRLKELLGAYRNAASPIPGDNSMRILSARPLPLIVYAMIHAGVPPDDPDLKEGIEVLNTMGLAQTYDVALAAMALSDLDSKKYAVRLAEIAQWFCDQQCVNGQWMYGNFGPANAPSNPRKEPKTETPSPKPADGKEFAKIKVTWKNNLARQPQGDNSNTQYALLGLRACLPAADIPKMPWQLSLSFFRKSQHGTGSWHYGAFGKVPGYGSMTAGGVSSVAICMRALGMDDELQLEKLKSQKEIRAAMEWIGAQFSVTNNPGNGTWVYYWLYGVERAGMILGVAEFGKHDWYKEGSEMLLAAQDPNGSWLSATDPQKNVDNDTCFAILFLRKATKGYTVSGQGGK